MFLGDIFGPLDGKLVVQPKTNFNSEFAHPHAILGVYDFLSSASDD